MATIGGGFMNYAYKRASTQKQGLRRQEEAFQNVNIDKECCDKLSGKNND